MSLLCRLGLHRPRGVPRWNDGFYFSTCESCGVDLIRTAFQRWHIPRGYRVVWSHRPPASRPEVALAREEIGPRAPSGVSQATADTPASQSSPDRAGAEAPPPPSTELPDQSVGVKADPAVRDDPLPAQSPAGPAASARGRLPIQDVLAHLQAQDAADRAETTPAPHEAQARRRRSTWDFMDEDPSEENVAFGLAHGRTFESPRAAGAPAPADLGQAGTTAASGPGRAGERWRRVRSEVRNFWSGPGEPRPLLVTGLALAVAVGVALALYWAGSPPSPRAASAEHEAREEGVESRELPDPFAASSPPVTPGDAAATEQGAMYGAADGDPAYVSASMLICREAPVLQARRVRNLVRGKEVRVLGYDGDWASIAYRGGQCWARADFISPVPPL
jgi:hypothetical protein